MSGHIEVTAPDGIGEVAAGTDLAQLVVDHLAPVDGDIVVITSKIVAKAEGRLEVGDREGAIDSETVRVVARRGPTRIARTRHGLTLAAAGVDASNVAQGTVVLLPRDPDASARAVRDGVRDLLGVTIGVIVTDTAGRAWREGQTDIAVGAAGLRVLDDHAGRHDPYGNELAVTAPAVADELAGAAELAQGKLAARPLALVRGRSDLVLGDDPGPGAAALIRPPGRDMFGFGAREAVVAVLAAGIETDELRDGFGAPSSPGDLAAALTTVLGVPVLLDESPAGPVGTSRDDSPARVVVHLADTAHHVTALDALARAFGWWWEPVGAEVRFHRGTP